MILQIRGTSGTGKTTLMRQLLAATGARAVRFVESKRSKTPLVYKGKWGAYPFYVFGPYESAGSGGCDRIRTVQEVITLVDEYAGPSHRKNGDHRAIIAFEGLLLAHSWGALGEHVHERYGHRYVNAFLDTTEKQAIKNVLNRRTSSNKTEERIAKIVKNVQADYYRVELCFNRVVDRGGRRIVIPYKNAYGFTKDFINDWVDTQSLLFGGK